MVFKLVRVDGSEPCKIPLPVGTHIVGRRKYLDCNDMRVSRNHGTLEVTEDTVILKSLHTNPCFYTKKSLNETQLVKKDETVVLFNGDKFGLVPDSYWYELLLCHVDEFPLKNPMVVTEEKFNDNEEQGDCDSTETITKENCIRPAECLDTEPLNEDNNVTLENEEAPDSPSMLAEDQRLNKKEQISLTAMEEEPLTSAMESNQAEESTQPLFPSEDESRTPVKRAHSSPEHSPNDEAKKIKKEPMSPEDVKPGPSNDAVSSPRKDGNNDGASANPPAPLRERCMYGANCYRKNLQHKAQFSHPSDTDWGSGAQTACPWGRACRRRDARHWRDHTHPPGAHPPDHRPGKRNRKKVVKKVSDEDSVESTEDLIVTGKRVRKTINRPDWSDSDMDSDSNKDPFQTDESDEWEPPSDVTESQDHSQY